MEFQKRVSYIYSFIPKTNMEKFPGEYGLKRVKLMLRKLENPQEKVKVIHIAGTSGKGSTSTMIAALIHAHGFRTGLHVKPHMYDIRERFQINGELISEEKFVKYADRFFSFIDDVNTAGYGKMTYFEVLITLGYYIFAQEKVDYAVVETGVGGTYDGSNTVTNPDKVCVITSIGFDHTAILGNTIAEIALQKAGIIQKGNTVFALSQSNEINTIISARSKAVKADIHLISEGKNFTVEPFIMKKPKIENIELGLYGDYQKQNAALALSVLSYLSERDNFTIDTSKTLASLKTVRIPGRFDVLQFKNKTLILDGAHNTQKMDAFLYSLQKAYPGKTFQFLLGFKEGKEIDKMVKRIIPLAKKIHVTDFFNNQIDFVSLSSDLHSLAEVVIKNGYKDVEIIYNAADVIEELADSIEDDILVITGSLYLLSDIYKSLRRIQSIKV